MNSFDYLASNPVIFVGAVFVFGLIWGSFLNVVIYRLPVMLRLDWLHSARAFLKEIYSELPEAITKNPAELPEEPFNLSKPDSRCPKCDHQIRWYENIPLISYLVLKGKCSNCKTPISIRYPLVELATGILSAVAAYMLGFTFETLAVLGFTWCLVALTMIDFDHQLLPDNITLPLLWAGLLINCFSVFAPITDAVIGAAAGYLVLWSIYWIFKLLTGKEGMGYGDFKLLAALGAWMGWQQLPVIIILSSAVGAVIGIGLIIFKGRDKNIPMPFGPYLAIAGWIALFWGNSLIEVYNSWLT